MKIYTTLIRTLLQRVHDLGYYFSFECDGEEFLSITNDVDKGVIEHLEVDELFINIWRKDREFKHLGWILWINWNYPNDEECLSDYTCNLDDVHHIGISELSSAWADKYDSLRKDSKDFVEV